MGWATKYGMIMWIMFAFTSQHQQPFFRTSSCLGRNRPLGEISRTNFFQVVSLSPKNDHVHGHDELEPIEDGGTDSIYF